MTSEKIGICIPVYDHIGNENLAAAIWSIKSNSPGWDYQLSLGIGKNCVAKNRNKALARLDPDIRKVIMMDDDVLVPYNFITGLKMDLDYREEIGVVGASMVGPRGEAQNDCHPNAIEGNWRVTINLPGTCFMYDRVDTPIVFDEAYLGSQWEDTDAMRQVQAMGQKTVCTSRVQIMHRNNWSENKWWAENKMHFYSKWPKP